MVLAPGLLVVALGFSNGGYFAGSVAVVVIVLLVLLILGATMADHPLAGTSRGFGMGAGALALLAVWTLASGSWSDAEGRAVVEYDRALLYLLAFVAVGALGRTSQRLRWLVRGLAVGAVIVCVCGLITRTLPDVWHVAPEVANDRLSYPLTYWNALGLLAVLGITFCLALSADADEHPVTRVLASAALPLLGATLLLTFSRASLVLAVVAALLVLAVGRPRYGLSALLAALPLTGLAIGLAYGADLLASVTPTTPAATDQGHRLAAALVGCSLGAAVVRAALGGVEERLLAALPRVSPPAVLRRPALAWGAAAGVAAGVVAVALALGAADRVQRQYDKFVDGDRVSASDGDQRSRLTQVGNNGRLGVWRVARDSFRAEPLHGTGAGTYDERWNRNRTANYQVRDAHSLYLEVLGELGVIGLLLVVVAVLAVLTGFALRARGPDRVLGAALLSAGIAWAVHAGVDWDWEMPAATLWFFAAGGLALAAVPGQRCRPALVGGDLPGTARIAVGLACLLAAIVPARIFSSQRALDASREAFGAGDCRRTIDRALASTSALGVRPEPFLLLGYCDVRLGQDALALRAMRRAVQADPRDWETHYGLALAQASAGRDPRPALRLVRRLNPLEALPVRTQELLATNDPREWRRRAARARLPTD